MEIDWNVGAAHDEESVRSDDSSASARYHGGQEEDESASGEEEERDPVRQVEDLISKLESNEWVGHEMKLGADMLPHLLHRIERVRWALRGNIHITELCIEVSDLVHLRGDTALLRIGVLRS